MSVTTPALPPDSRSRARSRRERRRLLGSVFIWGTIVLLLLWTLLPFYWAFISSIKDPSGKDIETVRAIRDEIAARVEALADELTPD